MGQVLGPHRAFQHLPQRTYISENRVHSRSVHENKQAGPLWQRPGNMEAKKVLSNLHKSSREEQVPSFQISDRRRLQSRIGPSLQEYLEWSEYVLGGTICRTAKFRTPTTTIIFNLVTNPNMVEFVFMDSKVAEDD